MKLLKTRKIRTQSGFIATQLTYELNKSDYIFYKDKDTGVVFFAIHKKLCDKDHWNYWYNVASYSRHFIHEGKKLFNAVDLREDYANWGLTSDDGEDIIVKWKD